MSGRAKSGSQGVSRDRAPFAEYEDTVPDGSASKITRKRDGCFTCRIRKKPCPTRHSHPSLPSAPCDACRRLCIECLGWGETRPAWMMSEDVLSAIRADIKFFLDRYYDSPRPAILSFSRYYASDPGWQAPFPQDEPSLLSWSSARDVATVGLRQALPQVGPAGVAHGQVASPPILNVSSPPWQGPALYPLSRAPQPSQNIHVDATAVQPGFQPTFLSPAGISPQAYAATDLQPFDAFMMLPDATTPFRYLPNAGALPEMTPPPSDALNNSYFATNIDMGFYGQ